MFDFSKMMQDNQKKWNDIDSTTKEIEAQLEGQVDATKLAKENAKLLLMLVNLLKPMGGTNDLQKEVLNMFGIKQ